MMSKVTVILMVVGMLVVIGASVAAVDKYSPRERKGAATGVTTRATTGEKLPMDADGRR